MQEQIIDLRETALTEIKQTQGLEGLEGIRIKYLGKAQGKLTLLLKKISSAPVEQRANWGKLFNEAKNEIEEALSTRISQSQKQQSQGLDKKEWLDVSLPGTKPALGHVHMVTQVLDEVLDIFKRLGYQTADGLEIESDYYNFTALNMPADSPSRDTQATFYLDTKDSKKKLGESITRTQLSGMQVRIMEKTKPPTRVVIPGKVYRVDDVDASHGFEFWQLEGMLIDKNVRLTDLLGTMEYVLKALFGQTIKIRFDCTYFAFVEPGVQAYMSCTVCDQKGCPFCKHTGWVEIMPAGMIHPNVLRAGGVDPREWNGFAFCIGLSRAVVLKYQIDDLRVLTNPDLRVLRQF